MNRSVFEKYREAPKTWYIKLVLALITAALIAWSSSALKGGAAEGHGWSIAGRIISGIFHPDTELLFDLTKSGVAYLLLETMCIAFLGTLVGAVFSIPLSFLSATARTQAVCRASVSVFLRPSSSLRSLCCPRFCHVWCIL